MYRLAKLPFLLLFLSFACQSSAPLTGLEKEIDTLENGLMGPLQIEGVAPETFNIEDRMAHYKVPGVSIAVQKDGKLHWAKGYGTANAESGSQVDTETLFQAGSISKPLAALAVHKLVQDGLVDLDEDVNTYLKDWKVPESRFLSEKTVTLRRLLTHTAGMTVHGFPGYTQTDTFPSLTSVLNGMGNTPAIYVDTFPEAMWRYSGGGYSVMEKVVEDVSGKSLEAYMKTEVLEPLGMPTSSYSQPLAETYHAKASAAYDREGQLIEGLWHNYPERAAAGLWTTPTELVTYVGEMQQTLAGQGGGLFNQETVEAMLTPHMNNWGLGPALNGSGDSLKFGHGGKNAGFTNQMMAYAHQGDGVIIMTNADNGGALIREILLGISAYYDWDFALPETVKPITLSEEQLELFAGTYRFSEEVPDVDDYLVTVEVKGDQLAVEDLIQGEKWTLTPLAEKEFLDLEKGDRAVFTEVEGGYEMNWNNRFIFLPHQP